MKHPLPRRALLLVALASQAAGRAMAQGSLPESATLLLPGPDAGPHARWVERLLQALPAGVEVVQNQLGGPDGVTAANRFAAEAAPDGHTLLVLAGGVAQARLAGDARSKAEAQGWLPVCASLGSAVLAGRGPRPSPLSSPGAPPIRTAIGPPEGSGAAALLALDLLDIPALALPGNPATLWQEGNAQALLLSGAEVPQRLAALGATPWCVLDAERDPELPETPTLAELAPGAPPPLLAACRAASAAARLLSALVLPALTPADQVALWRNATQRWVEEEARAGIPANGQALPGAEAAALLAAALAPPDVVLAYREWLLRRLGWQGER